MHHFHDGVEMQQTYEVFLYKFPKKKQFDLLRLCMQVFITEFNRQMQLDTSIYGFSQNVTIICFLINITINITFNHLVETVQISISCINRTPI